MDKTDFLYLEAFTKKRYMHWTSCNAPGIFTRSDGFGKTD